MRGQTLSADADCTCPAAVVQDAQSEAGRHQLACARPFQHRPGLAIPNWRGTAGGRGSAARTRACTERLRLRSSDSLSAHTQNARTGRKEFGLARNGTLGSQSPLLLFQSTFGQQCLTSLSCAGRRECASGLLSHHGSRVLCRCLRCGKCSD